MCKLFCYNRGVLSILTNQLKTKQKYFRTKLNSLLSTIFFLLLFANNFFALGENIRFEHITINDGLSQSSVRAVYQDSYGFMWFGTNDGLNRYDGFNFKVFKNDPKDTTSISNNFIYDLVEDNNGILWIGTSHGLNKYDRSTDKFTQIYFPNIYEKSIPSQTIYSIDTFDEDSVTAVWFSTLTGVFRYSPESEKMKYYNFLNGFSSWAVDKKIFLHKDHRNQLWAFTNMDGIYKLNKEVDEFVRVRLESNGIRENNQLSDVYEDEDGNFWFGSINGLNKYNPETGELKVYKEEFESALNESLNTGFINSIAETKDGNLYLATGGYGLIRFNKHTSQVRVFKNNPFNNRTINLDVAHIVYTDNTEVLWIGTGGKGVDKMSPYLNNFNTIVRTRDGLSINSIRTFFEDADGYLWISGYDGLDRYDPKKDKFESFYSNKKLFTGSRLNEIAYAIIEDKERPEKYLYFGTEGMGVFRYNISSEIFEQYYFSNFQPGENIIKSLYDDGNGNLWIGTNIGLLKLNKSSRNSTRYLHNPDDTLTIGPQNVTVIYEDSFGNFWLGTDKGGLNLMNRENETFKKFSVSLNKQTRDLSHAESNSITGNFIKCVYEDSDKNLWIGTTSGLNKLNRDEGTFEQFTVNDGLPNNVVYGILEDDTGNLWLSTNYGLSRFNYKKKLFKNFNHLDGLQSNEFNTNAYLKTSNGHLLFGGINGFNYFDPAQIKLNKTVPNIVLTEFLLFNRMVEVGQEVDGRVLLNNTISLVDTIVLNYQDNIFSFEYAALDYSSSGKNKYSYRLLGFNNKFSLPTTKRSVTFTNLDPGKYVLNIIGTNSNGVWNKNGINLHIIIKPPFWLTWWFLVLIVFLVISTMYSVYRYRISKITELERLRLKIASDLHDEVGSTLTKVSMRAQMLEMQTNDKSGAANLKRISEQSREAVTTMRDIVWAIDSRNDRFENLVTKIKDTAHSLLSEQGVHVDFKINGLRNDDELPLNFRQNLFLVLKEALNNVAKHSNADKVEISINNNDDYLKMTIKDNGSNFNKRENLSGQGLRNMQMRAEKINGAVEFGFDDGFKICLKTKSLK